MATTQCKNGTWYNSAANTCDEYPTCDVTQTYNLATNKCEEALSNAPNLNGTGESGNQVDNIGGILQEAEESNCDQGEHMNDEKCVSNQSTCTDEGAYDKKTLSCDSCSHFWYSKEEAKTEEQPHLTGQYCVSHALAWWMWSLGLLLLLGLIAGLLFVVMTKPKGKGGNKKLNNKSKADQVVELTSNDQHYAVQQPKIVVERPYETRRIIAPQRVVEENCSFERTYNANPFAHCERRRVEEPVTYGRASVPRRLVNYGSNSMTSEPLVVRGQEYGRGNLVSSTRLYENN